MGDITLPWAVLYTSTGAAWWSRLQGQFLLVAYSQHVTYYMHLLYICKSLLRDTFHQTVLLYITLKICHEMLRNLQKSIYDVDTKHLVIVGWRYLTIQNKVQKIELIQEKTTVITHYPSLLPVPLLYHRYSYSIFTNKILKTSPIRVL